MAAPVPAPTPASAPATPAGGQISLAAAQTNVTYNNGVFTLPNGKAYRVTTGTLDNLPITHDTVLSSPALQQQLIKLLNQVFTQQAVSQSLAQHQVDTLEIAFDTQKDVIVTGRNSVANAAANANHVFQEKFPFTVIQQSYDATHRELKTVVDQQKAQAAQAAQAKQAAAKQAAAKQAAQQAAAVNAAATPAPAPPAP